MHYATYRLFIPELDAIAKKCFYFFKISGWKKYYKNTQAWLIAGKKIGLEVNAEKIQHMFMY
jgi:hypothetical protein